MAPDASNHGRLIEALVWFYQATGEPLAYELADRYAGFHLAHTVSADGRFPKSSTAAHTHSYLGTLRGLWLWGMLTGQRECLQRVADTYRVTVPRAVLESGFACHDLWKDDPNRGEVGSTSDATQLALWIARDAGATELLDDVERVVAGAAGTRADHREPSDPGCRRGSGRAGRRRVRPARRTYHRRHRRHAARAARRQEAHHGRDRGRPALPDRRPWPHRRAHLRGRHGAAALRLGRRSRAGALGALRPGRGGCGLRVGTTAGRRKRAHPGAPVGAARVAPPDRGRGARGATPGWGDFAFVPSCGPAPVELRYSLPRRTSRERVGQVEVEYHWRGDEIVGVTPQSDFYPMYPAA